MTREFNLLSLRFSTQEREDAFGEWEFEKAKLRFILGLALSSFSFAIIFLLDYLLLGRFDTVNFVIRVLAFPTSNLIFWLILHFGKISKRGHLDLLTAIFVVVSQSWQLLIAFLYPELGEQYLFVMILLSFMGTITFSNLTFRYLVPAIVTVMFIFLAKIHLWDDLSTPQLAFQTLISVMFSGIGLTSGYFIERAVRVEYLNKMDLLQKQKELLAKNKELEQFAYIASHDLQEPLRSITSFSQLLKEDMGEQLGPEGGQYINFLLEASNRMRNLIKGLLDYSRLGRETELTLVDTKEMLSAIQMDLNTAIAESETQITLGKLPTLKVYETEFRQLLQNLLTNAIKFRKPGVAPLIHVEALRKGTFWEFSVQDNGIGIEEEFQEKIFLIFQRLHSRSVYEGTGIGLANCRKIVELHGGNIHVVSQKDHGSTFFFTIPIK